MNENVSMLMESSDVVSHKVKIDVGVNRVIGSNQPTYMIDQGALVLKSITLAEMVKFVVEMLVDLARSSVFYK